MSEAGCVFCDLLENLSNERDKLKIVYESDSTLAFYSTQPFAEIHIIVISKRHVPTIFDLTEDDNELKLDMFKAISIASQEVIQLKGACKTEMYLGTLQWVKHIHCHVIFDSTLD